MIEQQNDETRRHLEKVMSAEIKLRKQTDANFDDRLQNYDEKFTYAMSSFQAALGSLGNKVVEQKETVRKSSLSVFNSFLIVFICRFINVVNIFFKFTFLQNNSIVSNI